MTRTTVITGGTKRVGKQIASTLAAAGHRVIITTREVTDGDRAFADSLGHASLAISLDLNDPASLDACLQQLAGESISGIVHNASIYEPTKLDDITLEIAERYYRVHAAGPLVLTAKLAPQLAQSQNSAIVCMADIHVIGRPRTHFAPYSMSKAALVEMVRSLSRDLAPHTRVNGIAPGVILWPDDGHESDDASQQAYLKRVPLDRSGTPEEAAEAVRWLLDDASYTTGQIIRIDGGRWLA